jgi:hypothetical protein
VSGSLQGRVPGNKESWPTGNLLIYRAFAGNEAPGGAKEKFSEQSFLLHGRSGNRVDWSRALKEKMIVPTRFLKVKPPPGIAYGKTLSLEAEWERVPPAIFPHKIHTAWLTCANCHPEIFNIQKKTRSTSR